MLDIKLLREIRESIQQNLIDRNVRIFADIDPNSADWAAKTVERLYELDQHYLDLLRQQEQLRRRQNEISEQIKAISSQPKAQQAALRTPLIEEGRALREHEKNLSIATEKALEQRDAAWSAVPNLTHPDAPRGYLDSDHRELRRWGKIRDFAKEGFTPRDHLEIGEALGIIDFSAGAKVAGQKFYYLKNAAVYLELALQQYALETAEKHGFQLYTTPDLARVDILQGLGFNPRGESSQVYSIANSDLCLIGTAEITLGGMLADTILEEEQLPLLVAGLSHCFRTEAGAAGKESRGLYRVHQFTKVELFAFTSANEGVSEEMHQRILAIEEEIFQGLQIPYRVIDVASGDLGGQAYRKYDLEAWMPGRGDFGEVTSASNCLDYQARRLKIRYRPRAEDESTIKTRYVHMLNGTAIACSRALVAILENYQQADGSVEIPAVLRPRVGKSIISANG